MIIRTWLILGTLIVAGAWGLTVLLSPPPYQASPGSFAETYRTEALLPAPGELEISEEIGHEVFEIPESDAEHIAATAAEGGGSMPGMAMPEPGEMEQAAPSPPAMEMEQPMPEQPAPSTMPGMTMGGEEGHEEGDEGHMGGYGIAVVPAAMSGMATRTVEVEMSEWGFKPATLEVAPGEVIHFVVRNAGKLPHEFMFMPGIAMQALNYRLTRADWNLTEHEAIFEQEVILPGDSLEVTLRIVEPGSWMYMCMFPYHMQFGMMGMMMSEGAGMPGMDMGGMKM